MTPAAPGIGILLIVAAVFCFAGLDTTTKMVALTAPAAMLIWFRYLFQTVTTSLALLPRHGKALMHTKRPVLQFVRGILLALCSLLAFYSLKTIPVGEFTAIVMITPLVMTIFAALSLREHVSVLRWLCVLGGFVGTLIVIRPGSEVFRWAMLLPLALVAANTGYQLLTSLLTRTEEPGTLHFYTGVIGLGLSTLALPFAWQSLPWQLWALMLLVGLFSTLGHYLLIMAYMRAPVAVLTPYLYLQIGFANLAGWLVFSHIPDQWALLGIVVLTLSGIAGTWLTARESRQLSGLTEQPVTSLP